MNDIREKVKKLLTLAESPNENEAKSALLKARELMAKHKISNAELEELKSQKVVEIETGVSFTTLTNAWVGDLSCIISEHYCCKSICARGKGEKTNRIIIIGLENDVDVCNRVFRYAYDFVVVEGKQITDRYKKIWIGSQIRKAKEAYGFGFCAGLYHAFNKQDAESQEYALVLKTPKQVLDELKRQEIKDRPPIKDSSAEMAEVSRFRIDGYNAGKQFDPSTKLEG